jgi:hypothetical protein
MRRCRKPSQMDLFIVHLIPKGDTVGAVQPIGLFPTLVRLLDRWFRWNCGRGWSALQPATSHLGVRCHCIEKGMWKQTVLSEFSTLVGRGFATLLLDIMMAFEAVSHRVLAAQAMEQGFQLGLLRWLLSLLLQPRSISYQGLLTSPVSASCSIVPESSHADLLMWLMAQPVVSMIRTRWPYNCVSVVVDNLQISLHGKSATVQKDMCDVVDAVFL